MHAHKAQAILLLARGISPTKLYALAINLPPGEVPPACGAERFQRAPFPGPLALDPSNESPPPIRAMAGRHTASKYSSRRLHGDTSARQDLRFHPANLAPGAVNDRSEMTWMNPANVRFPRFHRCAVRAPWTWWRSPRPALLTGPNSISQSH